MASIEIFKDGKFLYPKDGLYYPESEYLRTAIDDEKVRWLANLITHYRHNEISSWNKMWTKGRRGKAYQSAANFGDYDEEKAKVNNRAKRQLIRKYYPVLLQAGIEVKHIASLQNTEPETIAVANKFLPGKIEIELTKKVKFKKTVEILSDASLMPYGQYKDVEMKDVPPEYLMWLWNNDRCSESVKEYVSRNKQELLAKIEIIKSTKN